MAYTFLKAKGYNVGKSLVDDESILFCQNMLKNYPDKIILPVDSVVSLEISDKDYKEKLIDDIDSDEIGLDIGTKTVALFSSYLKNSQTIIWNGPLGYFEIDSFSNGTKLLCEELKNIPALKIIGGGDTVSAVDKLGYSRIFDHISTGGGATLSLLEGKTLKAIEIISDKDE